MTCPDSALLFGVVLIRGEGNQPQKFAYFLATPVPTRTGLYRDPGRPRARPLTTRRRPHDACLARLGAGASSWCGMNSDGTQNTMIDKY